MFKNFFAPLQQLKSEEKKSILFTAICFFFVLFSYPLLRSTTTSLFLQAFGAKNSPVVWLFSIIVLSGVVTLFSKIQLKLKIHSLFLWTSIFSLVFFGVFTFLFSLDFPSVVKRKSKGNGPRSSQAYFLLIFLLF